MKIVSENRFFGKTYFYTIASRNVPVGRVLKVDGPYAAVKFPASASASASAASSSSASASAVPPPPPPKEPKIDPEDGLLNESTRLLRKDELQVVKTGILPRVPDCFQRSPKRICLQGEGTILAVTVDGQGGDSIEEKLI